jgi:hypothetical protein
MWFVPKYYNQGQSSSGEKIFSCQLMEVKWSSLMVSEWEGSVVSWLKWREVACWWVRGFSCQLSEVTWNCRLVSERVQLSVEWSDVKLLVDDWESSVEREFNWKSACEEKTRRLVWNGHQPETKLAELSVDKSSARAAVTRGPEHGKLKNLRCAKSVTRKRLVGTVIDWKHQSLCVSDL